MILAAHQINSLDQVKKECLFCKNSFFIKKSIHEKGGGKFCSHKCHGFFKREKYDYDVKNTETERTCRECGEKKPITEFSPDNRYKKRTHLCKKCKNEWMRDHRKKNPDHYRNMDMKQLYGINSDQYNNLLKLQNGVCAICKKPESQKRGWLHIDHCHRTRKVRGLLCGNCNTGIGKLGEDIDVLIASIEYLRRVQG